MTWANDGIWTNLPDDVFGPVGSIPAEGFRGVPRGPLWNRRALFMPADAVPFHANGLVEGVGFGTFAPAIELRVRSDVNGLRIARMYFGIATASTLSRVGLWRDGNPIDGISGNYPVVWAGSPSFVPALEVCAVFQSGSVLQLMADNRFALGGTLSLGGLLTGWYF